MKVWLGAATVALFSLVPATAQAGLPSCTGVPSQDFRCSMSAKVGARTVTADCRRETYEVNAYGTYGATNGCAATSGATTVEVLRCVRREEAYQDGMRIKTCRTGMGNAVVTCTSEGRWSGGTHYSGRETTSCPVRAGSVRGTCGRESSFSYGGGRSFESSSTSCTVTAGAISTGTACGESVRDDAYGTTWSDGCETTVGDGATCTYDLPVRPSVLTADPTTLDPTTIADPDPDPPAC